MAGRNNIDTMMNTTRKFGLQILKLQQEDLKGLINTLKQPKVVERMRQLKNGIAQIH